MSLYADRHGLDVVSCRIGSFRAEPTTARNLATWLSHDDCVRMVEAALTTPAPGFAVLYGISHNTRGLVGPRARPRPGLRPAWTTPRTGRTGSSRARRTRRRTPTSAGSTSPIMERPALDRRLDLECTPTLTLGS